MTGLRVYGDSGILQIDGEYRNHKLVKHHYIPNAGLYTHFYDSGSYSDSVIVAIRVTTSGKKFRSFWKHYPGGLSKPSMFWAQAPAAPAGTTLAVVIDGGFYNSAESSGNLGGVHIYIYDVPSVPSSGFGMYVYDGGGRMVFSSDGVHLKVAGMVTGNLSPGGFTSNNPFVKNGPRQYHTFPSGTYAVATIQNACDYKEDNRNEESADGVSWFDITSNQVGVTMVTYLGGWFGKSAYYHPYYCALVLDVADSL